MNGLMWAIKTEDVEEFSSAIYSPLIMYTPFVIDAVYRFATKNNCPIELAYLLENIEITPELCKKLLNITVTKNYVECFKLLANSKYAETHSVSQYLETAILSNSIHCARWIINNTTEQNFIWSCITACMYNNFEFVKLLVEKLDTKVYFTNNALQEKFADAVGKSGNIEIYELTKHMLQEKLQICINSSLSNGYMNLVLHILTTYTPSDAKLAADLEYVFKHFNTPDLLQYVKTIWPRCDRDIFRLAIKHSNLTILDFVLEHPDFKIVNCELCNQLEILCTSSFANIKFIERLLSDSRISLVEFTKRFVKHANYSNEGMCEVADALMSDPAIFWECATHLQKQQWYAAQRKKYAKLHAELITRT